MPVSTNLALPLIVALMLDNSLVFRFASKVAKLDLAISGGGDPDRLDVVGGLCETQSWTRSETRGLERRLRVFCDWREVVMIIEGSGVYGVLGR